MSGAALSIVVIGRNEGNRLTACFESICASRGLPEPTELIYVDSHSTDGSADRAAAWGASVVVLESGRLSAARARNAGWRLATAPLVLFLDGDTILRNDFVLRAMEEFNKPSVAVVWGHRREIRPESSLYSRVLDLDWIYPPGLTDFCGGDALMRRSSLEQVNGFNPNLIAGEEPEMCRRLRAAGNLIVHIDVPMTGHDLAIHHFDQYWRRSVRTGHAYAEIAAGFRDTSDPFWSSEARGNLLRGTLYLSVAAALCGFALAERSWAPLLAGWAGLAVLAVRTAFSSRWKGASWSTLLLFGVHSHVQHVPILQGQFLFHFTKWRKGTAEIIEYKNGSR